MECFLALGLHTNESTNDLHFVERCMQMTDLPTVLPDFSTRPYTHLIPSLDRHGITVTDLLSLDALEIAKRATLPILDLRRLAQEIAQAIQHDLEISVTAHTINDELFTSSGNPGLERYNRPAKNVLKSWNTVSLLDAALDKAIGGGIPTGYVTEITGERSTAVLSIGPSND